MGRNVNKNLGDSWETNFKFFAYILEISGSFLFFLLEITYGICGQAKVHFNFISEFLMKFIKISTNKYIMMDRRTDSERQRLVQKIERGVWSQCMFQTVAWKLTMKINEEKNLLLVKMSNEMSHKIYEKTFESGSLKSLEKVYRMFELIARDTQQYFDLNLQFIAFQQEISLSSCTLKVSSNGRIWLSWNNRIGRHYQQEEENLHLQEVEKQDLICYILEKLEGQQEEIQNLKQKNYQLQEKLEKMERRVREQGRNLENIRQIEKTIKQLQEARSNKLDMEQSGQLVELLQQIEEKQQKMELNMEEFDTKIYQLSRLPAKLKYFKAKLQQIDQKVQNIVMCVENCGENFISLANKEVLNSKIKLMESHPSLLPQQSQRFENSIRNQTGSKNRKTIVWV